MKISVKDCKTLGEYRRKILKQPQSQVARTAGCQQGWISQVECGHLPAEWHREALLRAYRLDRLEADFVRLVNGAKKSPLSTPFAEELPLFAASRNDTRGDVVSLPSVSPGALAGAAETLRAAMGDTRLRALVESIAANLLGMPPEAREAK